MQKTNGQKDNDRLRQAGKKQQSQEKESKGSQRPVKQQSGEADPEKKIEIGDDPATTKRKIPEMHQGKPGRD